MSEGIAETAKEKMYAGKFKTVEDLEKGYNNTIVGYGEIKKKYDSLADQIKIPEEYEVPEDAELPEEEVALIKTIAKEAELSQPNFEKLTKSYANKAKVAKEAHEAMQNEALSKYEPTELKIVQDFVKENYPESVQNHFNVADEATFKFIKEQRDAKVNNNIAGLTAPGASAVSVKIDESMIIEARNNANKNQGDKAARDKYIDLLSQQARQNRQT